MIIRGRNFISLSGGTVTPPLEPSDITLRITFTGSNPSISTTDMKYDKSLGYLLVKDDGYSDDYHIAYAYLTGNVVAKDGVQYQGIGGTDGCGNLVKYRYSFAINTNAPRDGSGGYSFLTSWSQYQEMLQNNFAVMNHSWTHGGTSNYKQIRQAEIDIYNNLGIRPTTFVVPTADAGYAVTAPYLGYKLVGSAFGVEDSRDGQEVLWQYKDVTDPTKLYNKIWSRGFSNTWSEGAKDEMNYYFDQTVIRNINGKKFFGHAFSHGLTNDDGATNFSRFREHIEYVHNHPQNNDKLWMPNAQEWVDYYEMKKDAIINQQVDGNVLTVNISMANVHKNVTYRDLSFLVSGATITNLEYEGVDNCTFNTQTGLINIFKRNFNVIDPSTETEPPQITSVVRSGNQAVINYDKPIVLNELGTTGFDGNKAYAITDNTVLSVSGSGTQWTLNCQNAISNTAKFYYRMQRGNATGVDGMKVCSYIGFAIT